VRIASFAVSQQRLELPLPLAGEGWGGRAATGLPLKCLQDNPLSVPSPLVGEGQGGG